MAQPNALLHQGITAAKAGDKQTARQFLLKAIETEPRNESSWLWLAITAESLDERVGYLQQALTINPENPRTKATLAKLQKQHHALQPAESSWKCPLCQASAKTAATQCLTCGAILKLTDLNALLSNQLVDENKLHEAISRLRTLALSEDAVNEKFYLGLAYLNLNHPVMALPYLQAVIPARPNDTLLLARVKQLMEGETDAAKPAKPIKPEEPAKLVEPEEPAKPIKPEEPAKLVKPEEPAKPIKPEEPAKPIKLEEPAKPVKREKSVKPIKREEPAKPVKPEEPAKPQAPSLGTIMIVDDSHTICKLVSMTLKRQNYDVVIAVDGMDALAKLNEMIPDLILLDITMPRMDGYQVCKVVKGNEETKRIPVVMLSGKDGFFDKVRGRMAGATDYITKPFEPQELVKSVKRHMEQAVYNP